MAPILLFTNSFILEVATFWTVGSGARKGYGDDQIFPSILPPSRFDKYMKAYRFKHFRAIIPAIWADETLKDTDEWRKFQPGIDEFNSLRREQLVTSVR